jgi:Zn-dependent protease/CBS domain-containing protein
MELLEFFKRQFLLTHVFDIPVRIDYRWFLVLILLAWLTAVYIPVSLVESGAIRLLLGLATTIVFFASIFLHELAHAVIARMEQLEVVEIVLHPFGGLARFRHAPDTPRAEFRIAIAGPAASLLISVIFLILTLVFNSFGENIASPLFFLLFLWNLLIAVFNLLPGYPLDGGRVLRSYLWSRGRDFNEATILTGRSGQIIAVTMIVIGFLITFGRGDIFTGLWTLVIGLFLFTEARNIIRQTHNIESTLVAEVMSLPFAIAPDENLLHFVDNILPLHRQTVFPVSQNKQLYGILTLEDVKETKRESWHTIKIREAMRPITVDYFVENYSFLSDARVLMRENGIGAVAVVDEKGELVGFLHKNRIKKVR